MLWGTDFRWVKMPKLEHKWFFPGNKHTWLLICCNFLLYLVKTAITYLFHIPPQHRCSSVCPCSEHQRAACAGPRVPAPSATRGRFAPRMLHCWQHYLFATDAALPPAQDNGVLEAAGARKALLWAVSPAEETFPGALPNWPWEKLDGHTS